MKTSTILTAALGLTIAMDVAVVGQEDARPSGRRGNRPSPARLFEQFDRDGDGLLGPDEASERIKARFEEIDADRDGKISRQELRAFVGRGAGSPAAMGHSTLTQMVRQLDRNENGSLERDELPVRMRERFDQFDGDQSGALDPRELEEFAGRASRSPQELDRRGQTDPLFRLLDTDRDGALSGDELENAPQQLATLDRNRDGVVDRSELQRPRGAPGRPGEIITPAAKGERLPDQLAVGDPAPDFTLPLISGEGSLTLSTFREQKPVVLIFASYT